MPELPEVETVVRTVRPSLVGARIAAVTSSGHALRLGRALDLRALETLAVGARVRAVRRRGKYILIDLERETARGGGLLVHLGMSGSLRVQAARVPRVPHTHVVWTLDDGARELRYIDPRRFGFVAALADLEGAPELAHLGPDPLLDLNPTALSVALARSRAPLKAFLLDQRHLAGLGNIYVCEALFHARLHPETPAREAQRAAPALATAIQHVLTLGIENRGTTLRDFVDAHGGSGGNQRALVVYGREGEPCVTCARPIRRVVQAGRSTFFCGHCQKRPRVRRS